MLLHEMRHQPCDVFVMVSFREAVRMRNRKHRLHVIPCSQLQTVGLMSDRSSFGLPSGDTKLFFVSGPPGDRQIDLSWNVKHLLFGWARCLLMIGLSMVHAEHLMLGGLTVKAEEVMVRFSDEPVTGL